MYWNALQAVSDSRYSVFGFLSCHMILTVFSLYVMTMNQSFPILAVPVRQEVHDVNTLHSCPGLLKSIGVSNYTVDHLEELLQYATVVPAVLQVECLKTMNSLRQERCKSINKK